MKKRYSVSRSWLLGIGFAAWVFWLAAAAPFASAQFKLPKIPKLPKTGEKKSEPSRHQAHEAPEILTITPDTFPPGGSSELVLTGKGFFRGMRLIIGCGGYEPPDSPFLDRKPEKVRVENPERAVAHISIPLDAKEGPCKLYSVGIWGAKGVVDPEEIEESPAGTPEVLQMKSPVTFTISNASKVPVSVGVAYLGEGDMDFMQVSRKMGEAMMGGFGEKGEKTVLQMSPDTVKCVQGQKTIFSEPTSNVKETGEMRMRGQSMGIFRIVFKNGKIYNLMGAQEEGGSSEEQKKVYQFVKKKLGK